MTQTKELVLDHKSAKYLHWFLYPSSQQEFLNERSHHWFKFRCQVLMATSSLLTGYFEWNIIVGNAGGQAGVTSWRALCDMLRYSDLLFKFEEEWDVILTMLLRTNLGHKAVKSGGLVGLETIVINLVPKSQPFISVLVCDQANGMRKLEEL